LFLEKILIKRFRYNSNVPKGTNRRKEEVMKKLRFLLIILQLIYWVVRIIKELF